MLYKTAAADIRVARSVCRIRSMAASITPWPSPSRTIDFPPAWRTIVVKQACIRARTQKSRGNLCVEPRAVRVAPHGQRKLFRAFFTRRWASEIRAGYVRNGSRNRASARVGQGALHTCFMCKDIDHRKKSPELHWPCDLRIQYAPSHNDWDWIANRFGIVLIDWGIEE